MKYYSYIWPAKTDNLMADMLLSFIIPLASAALALWGSVFYEKDGWRKAGRFIVLLVGAAALALSVGKIMPALKELCSKEMLDESILKCSLALTYTGALTLMVVASFYLVVIDGLFGYAGGWLPAVGCAIAGMILVSPVLSLGIFIMKDFWWLALAVLAALAVIGAIIGGASSGGVNASSQGGVFVDKYGNEYISTTEQSRIYSGNETWNTTKEYHIKGQSGSFYRKVK